MGESATLNELAGKSALWRGEGRVVVFTNGCFDLFHAGHARYLNAARALGDILIVGLNSDSSVMGLKGEGRPVMPEDERSEILCALHSVDYVVIFDDPTPLRLIERLLPDVLVKGGDWAHDSIVGAKAVRSHQGRVETIPVLSGRSTSTLIDALMASVK